MFPYIYPTTFSTLFINSINYISRMQEVIESQVETEDEREHHQKYTISFRAEREEDRHERERYLQPPINIPARHYSLEPDCVGGWKPKKISVAKPKYVNIFPLRYDEQCVDEIIKEYVKNKHKYNEALIYLGPRRNNSYLLHQNRPYPNPYKIERRIDQAGPGRNGVSQGAELRTSYLRFNSDFQSGNLDAVIQRTSDEFDLFMRVDSNTRGHTNWYYFQVQNQQFIGTVTFTICNFRRPSSLYQRGLRPYVWSKERKEVRWIQQGEGVKYEKQRLRYRFLYDGIQEIANPMLNTYYALTFTYKFQVPHDTVRFAYCPPYPYSQLLDFLKKLENGKAMTPLKSLSGLPIPILKITNEQLQESGKKVVLVTGRIHPGESNSSYVAEGFLQYLCSNEPIAKQLRNKYLFYVVPMLNPDGVVAGNYRTSLFGKDLNRTFDQSRKFAFPEIYHLLRFAEELKKVHKKRFCIYIDLHGHSIKKNIFMYGPDYSLQDSYYDICRELPKILGNLTQYFRYYSCSFRISDSKTSTGRAVFNRTLKIPYTYTMESSNGCYFDFLTHNEIPFTIQRWKEMGLYLAKGLNLLKMQKLPKISRTFTQKITKKILFLDEMPAERVSDDDINEQDSDMEPTSEDLPDDVLLQLQRAVKGANNEDEGNKSVQITSNDGSTQKKRKKKQVNKLQELSKRQVKNFSNDIKPLLSKDICSYQIPQRKNINFPSVFPGSRGEIFINRHSRHEKYEVPMQIRQAKALARSRKNESHINKTVQNRKNTINISKLGIETDHELTGEIIHKKQFNFNELIKKYKFNF